MDQDTHDIVVIGGSSGAVDVLARLFADLPAAFPAAVLVCTHVGRHGPDALGSILDRVGPLPVRTAAQGDRVERGQALVAPAGHHLLALDGTIHLGRGPRENMSRPAVDALFRSAALSYASRVIGVLLTGLLDDGAAGLAAIQRCGGITVVQDPSDAAAASMPLAGLAACDVDYRTSAGRLAELLCTLVAEPAGPSPPIPRDIVLEVGIASGRASDTDMIAQIARPQALSCPACSGVLSELVHGNPVRFRCQIGHAYTAEALGQEQESAVSDALGVALRVLEERHTLMIKLAEDAQRRGNLRSRQQFLERAAEFREQAETIRIAALATLDLP